MHPNETKEGRLATDAMNEIQERILTSVDRHRQRILDAERYIWAHPETGFREWNTSKYLADVFTELGYTLIMAGNVPGFYTDIETGRPGPRVLVLCELDALLCAEHPDAVNGAVHCCGHNAQCAGLVGVAAALAEPGALDRFSGSIRLMAVPAEEILELGFREGLRRDGVIRYLGGKVEFMYRGYMDGVDLAFMIHAANDETHDFIARSGSNGCMLKQLAYRGKAVHASAPYDGVNALYAATLGLQAVNSLRETFYDEDHTRVHPILTAGGGAVNAIPAYASVESYVRGASLDAITRVNRRVNRAFAGAALSMGAELTITDRPGYHPLHNDVNLLRLCEECMTALVGKDRVGFDNTAWSAGCTDMGDISAVMPAIHPYACGATGIGHGADYRIADPERACVNSAKAQLLLLDALLSNDAAEAKRIVAEATPVFPSKEAYFAAMDAITMDRDVVAYGADGTAVVRWE